jgi:hypothetical protein
MGVIILPKSEQDLGLTWNGVVVVVVVAVVSDRQLCRWQRKKHEKPTEPTNRGGMG